MKELSTFGNRLKEQRKKLGLTQAEIAEKCGISMRMWGDYERDKYQPKSETCFLLEQMGIDIAYVMTGKPSIFRQPESALSPEETELLALFRQSSDLGRAVIISAARGAEKKETEIETRQVA